MNRQRLASQLMVLAKSLMGETRTVRTASRRILSSKMTHYEIFKAMRTAVNMGDVKRLKKEMKQWGIEFHGVENGVGKVEILRWDDREQGWTAQGGYVCDIAKGISDTKIGLRNVQDLVKMNNVLSEELKLLVDMVKNEDVILKDKVLQFVYDLNTANTIGTNRVRFPKRVELRNNIVEKLPAAVESDSWEDIRTIAAECQGLIIQLIAVWEKQINGMTNRVKLLTTIEKIVADTQKYEGSSNEAEREKFAEYTEMLGELQGVSVY